MEDMEQAVVESRSSVTVGPAKQRPLGDVNEYDDDEDEEDPTKSSSSKNKEVCNVVLEVER